MDAMPIGDALKSLLADIPDLRVTTSPTQAGTASRTWQPTENEHADCSTCQGKQWVRNGKYVYLCPELEAEQARTARHRTRLIIRQQSGLSPAVLDSAAATPWPMSSAHLSSMIGATAGWLEDPDARPWLAVIGPKGCGKTRLACWVTARLCDSLRPVRYYDAGEWLTDMMAMRQYDPEQAYHAEQDARSVEWLVLDELRTECLNSPAKQELLFGTLNARYRAGAHTMLISNLPHKEWQERLASRLADDKLVRTVNLAGAPNYRECGWPSS